jgi:hypothetical protein
MASQELVNTSMGQIDGVGGRALQRCGADKHGHGRGVGPASMVGGGRGRGCGWVSGGARLKWCERGADKHGHGQEPDGGARPIEGNGEGAWSSVDEDAVGALVRCELRWGAAPVVRACRVKMAD